MTARRGASIRVLSVVAAGGRDRADVVAVSEHFVSDGHTTHVSASSRHARAIYLVSYATALRTGVLETVVKRLTRVTVI